MVQEGLPFLLGTILLGGQMDNSPGESTQGRRELLATWLSYFVL